MRLIRLIRHIRLPWRRLSPKKRLYFQLLLGAILVVLVPLALIWIQKPPKAFASWYDDNWLFRKAVTVTVSSSSSDIRDLETLITVDTTGITASLQTNCEDLRFTNQTGDLLPYYAPSCSDNSATNKVWVMLDLVPKNTTTYTMYMYYGNPSAPATSDSQKFRLFNSLVGYWALNESSGNRSDSSVNSNTLTDNNTVTSATGQYSNAGQFTAANSEYLSITDNASISTGDIDFTASAWVYLDSKTAWRSIMAKSNGNDDFEYRLVYNVDTDRLSFQVAYTGGAWRGSQSADTLGSPSTGTWYFIVGWHDSTANTINIQINNGAVDSSAMSGAGIDNAQNLQIGGNGAGGYTMDGRIDDVRFYKRILSSGERTQLYNTPGNIASNANATTKPSTSFASEEKAPSPIAYWSFNEGQGTTAQDSTVNNNDGTLAGTTKPTWQTEDQCIAGKCLYFNGSTAYADMGTSSILNPTSNTLTLGAWVKTNSTTAGAPLRIITRDANTTNGEPYVIYSLSLNAVNAGSVYFEITTGGTRNGFGTAANSISANQWYYVAVTYDGTTAKIYINGNLNTSQSVSGNMTASSGKVFVGIRDANSPKQFFNGYIDEVKIYPYARTAAQILSDYNSRGSAKGTSTNLGNNASNTPPNVTNGLIGYWKMDDNQSGNAKTLVDSSTSGNNGTTANGANGTGMDCTVAGKYNGGCQLDGTDDQIQLPTAAAIVGSSNWTISAWVKGNLSSEDVIFAEGNSGSAGFAYATVDAGNTVSFRTDEGNVISNSAITSSWTHLVFTKSSSTISIYINGVLDKSGSLTFSQSSNLVTIGALRYQSSSNYSPFNGSMDEVRVYNSTLSQNDISTLYAQAPVGYWNFEEGSGTSVSDKSTQGNTGTWGGSGTNRWTSGKYGKAGNFNGSNDVVTITDPGAGSVLDMNGQITMSAWFKTSSSDDYSGIIEKSDGVAKGYQMTLHTGGNVRGDIYNGTTYSAVATTGLNLEDGKWHFMTTTYDGTTLRLYVDGVQQASTSVSGYLQSNSNDNSALLIGNDNCCGGRFFNGSIDEVKIYNYARTQKQIVADMLGGSVIASAARQSPVGYWKFDEGADNTCSGGTNDACNSGSAGQTLDGAGSGFASPATSTSGWTQAGKFGRGLIFDGSNDYINVPHNTTFNWGTGAFSISFWIKTTSSGSTFIMGRNNGSAGWYISYNEAGGGSDFKVRFQLYGELTGATGTTAINDGNWHHITAVRASSTVIYLYTDGKLEGTGNANNANVDLSNTALAIGDLRVGAGNYFGGTLDEVKVYNYALTADEVKLDYNRSSSLVLGSLSDNSSYQVNAANQEYCVPGDTTSCAAPVGRWDFEEGSGTSAFDRSGNAYTGTITGATYKPGKSGKALNFNGGTDVVDTISSISGLKTVSFWVKPTTTTGNFIDIQTSPSTINISASSGTMSATGFTSPTIYVNGVSGGTITANVWNHIEVTTGTAVTGSALRFGRISTTSLTGLIDSVRLFDYARSAAQIAWDYNRGAPIGHWKMDECQGTTANDSSGNSNHGTITIGASGTQTAVGTCTGSSNTAWKDGATGKYNSSLDFDGTDDYVNLSTTLASYFIRSKPFTLSAWIKTSASANQDIITNADWDSPYVGMEFVVNSSGQLRFDLNQSDTKLIRKTTSATVNDGNWHHVVVSYSGSGAASGVAIYDNTNALSTTTNNDNTDGDATSTTNLQIGAREGSNQPFSGQIDDVRVYNYALTPVQVKSLYNGGSVRFGPSTGSP